MMGFYDCMGAVATAIGRNLSPREFEALYERLLEEKDGLFKQGYPDDWLAASRVMAERIAIEKKLAERNLYFNKKVNGEFWSFYDNARPKVGTGDAIRAYTVGVNRVFEGSRRAVGVQQNGIRQEATGNFLADLIKQSDGDHRLEKLFANRNYELEIAKALRGEEAAPDAVKIAQAMNRVREDLRRRENDAGGWRGQLDGYVTHQSHDSLAIRRAGLAQWKADILPRLDPKTFDRSQDLKEQIRLERGQVLQHRLAAGREMMAIEQSLKTTAKLEKKAGARAERHLETLEGLRTDFAHLVGEYMATADQPTERRAWLKRELERLRGKMPELARKAETAEAAVPGLIEAWNNTIALSDRTSKAIELLDKLDSKMLEFDDRLQGAIDPSTLLDRIGKEIQADTWMKGDADAERQFSGVLKYIGPANLAKRRGAQRTLHFKTAEDEVWYMRKYGVGGLSDSFLREIESAANTIALYRQMGTSPEAMMANWHTEILRRAKAIGGEEGNRMQKEINDPRLEWIMKQITGQTRSVANPTVAAWAETIRIVQSMAKLGGAMLSSFADIPTAVAELRYQGVAAFDAYAQMFGGLMRGRGEGDRARLLSLLGVGFDGLTGGVLSRVAGEAAPAGWAARMSQLFFRLNGLTWWTDANKVSAATMLAHGWALVRGQAHDELDRFHQRALKQYGITAKDWDIIRQAAVQTVEGKDFLHAEGIRAIPLGYLMDALEQTHGEADMAAAERAARTWRDRVADAYGSMILDRVDYAVTTPGARERATITAGTQRGDILGEAIRFVTQFKSFSAAMMYRGIGRDIYGGEGGKASAVARFAWLAAQLSVFGYFSMMAKDALQGKNPRDPTDPHTIAAAMVQGGGMGLMGDFFFGEYNRYGQSFVSTLAGPTLGNVDQVMHAFSDAKDADLATSGRYGRTLGAETLRIAASNTPGASLWWLRPALNYMAIWPMQEALAPGYLRRMEHRIERDQKQTFWLRPTEVSR